ncbi:Smr/MutS family protein [Sediminibacterium ginsengisoli]|uniref:Smr domain-containing protein n=1 Tax=Sediminibacterium ginsengisoli TaxID=413434 RepID=A0A1T4QYY0_9BACT|nr:Smr/MutS family protein [Sediminibacterium ginsengisoli]SKA08933.1 Smr domain-containing protein [Sediminibacterium ginsengisoli]
MKYQVGDEIVVLHSNEEGKVIEIMNDKMVLIEVRGVKFPAYMDQIDFPYFLRFTKNKVVNEKKPAPKVYIDQVPKENSKPNTIRVADGVWLSFLPKFALDDFNDEVVELLKVHLVNKTDKGYRIRYKQYFFNKPEFELESEVHPFHDFYIHDIPFEAVNDSPSFSVDFSLLQPEKRKATHYETSLKLKPKQVFQRIEELKDNNGPTISYKLFDIYPDKTEEEKSDRLELSSLAAKGFKVYDASRLRQNLEPARSVVDLHIEKLTHGWEQMDNYEILDIQLKEFEKWYHLAVAHHQPSLTVIHGVGKGRLRDEIHDILKVKREVKTFVNQYDPRFGYGATEIFFK